MKRLLIIAIIVLLSSCVQRLPDEGTDGIINGTSGRRFTLEGHKYFYISGTGVLHLESCPCKSKQ